jgi:hypothetical protein
VNGLTGPGRVLLVLLAADALFVAGHFTYLHDRTLSVMWHLGTDGGYAEFFMYAKTLCAASMLAFLWRRAQEPVFGAWALFFAFVLCDDALRIHERGGRVLAAMAGLPDAFGVSARSLGELAVFGFFGVVFVLLIPVAHLRSSGAARRSSHVFAALFVALVVFGMGMDFLHTAELHEALKGMFSAVEDGGELITLSVVCWYALRLVLASRSGAGAAVPPPALATSR